jgi:hypothetical protein
MHIRSSLTFLLVLFLFSPTIAEPASQTLNEILQGHVREGKVDYESLRQDSRDELQNYVDSLSDVDPEQMTRSDQIAFWLDAYNSLVVHQIVEEDVAPDSARARSRFFRGRRYDVAGKSMTLDDIEHQALRPLAKDPRVHFVLVCGAKSCPPLRASSFLGAENLEESLEQATQAYVDNPQNVSIDPETRTVTLNKIFDWYAEDFGDVVEFIARYRPEPERQALLEGDWTLQYRDYDWSLNESQES